MRTGIRPLIAILDIGCSLQVEADGMHACQVHMRHIVKVDNSPVVNSL